MFNTLQEIKVCLPSPLQTKFNLYNHDRNITNSIIPSRAQINSRFNTPCKRILPLPLQPLCTEFSALKNEPK